MDAASGPNPPGDDPEPTWKLYAYDTVSSAAAVLLVGFLLFSVSGIWPPLVAITSGSMDPHMQKGDLVFVMETDRFAGEGHHEGTGVVTLEAGERTGYETFQRPGDVVVFAPDGNEETTPIIHRAILWVDEGDDWVARADPQYLGAARDCESVETCPADNPGFITRGDANSKYDQVSTHPGCDDYCDPVRPEWIEGNGMTRIPWVGNLRLQISRT